MVWEVTILYYTNNKLVRLEKNTTTDICNKLFTEFKLKEGLFKHSGWSEKAHKT